MEPLLPERHPTRDFFVADFLDAVPRDDMASMEHPIFSLCTQKDKRKLEYRSGENYLRIIPSDEGLPTIFDKDILIYCTSQLMQALNGGHLPSQLVRFRAHDLLVATNRQTDGDAYKRLREAFVRLRATTLETNIRTNGKRVSRIFGFVDYIEIIQKSDDEERMSAIEVKLSDWFYNSVIAREVLPISRDYFRLRRPTERRFYELARKHCGKQDSWTVGLKTLQTKLGTTAPLKKLRLNVRQIVASDHLPDYHVTLDDQDRVTFRPRDGSAVRPLPARSAVLTVYQPDDDTWQAARAAAPGWDIHVLLADWKAWAATKDRLPRDLGKAFVAFCRKKKPLR